MNNLSKSIEEIVELSSNYQSDIGLANYILGRINVIASSCKIVEVKVEPVQKKEEPKQSFKDFCDELKADEEKLSALNWVNVRNGFGMDLNKALNDRIASSNRRKLIISELKHRGICNMCDFMFYYDDPDNYRSTFSSGFTSADMEPLRQLYLHASDVKDCRYETVLRVFISQAIDMTETGQVVSRIINALRSIDIHTVDQLKRRYEKYGEIPYLNRISNNYIYLLNKYLEAMKE